ncbi:MAG: alpha/beta fold hydrolase [Candidatus Limnocylindria bacterium]
MSIELAHDDSGGPGRLVLLLPGAGDLRSENRFLALALASAGHRVVSADLPGHGGSPAAAGYGVEETAAALVDLIDHLEAGPAVVVGASFAPAAAVWAATSQPDRVDAVVAISPHFESDDSLKGMMLTAATRGLLHGWWAAPAWERLYRSWYKSRTPDDLDVEIQRMRTMLADPERRKAVRETLTAHRHGVADRMAEFDAPSLVVFGEADDHFADPAAEAARVASRLGGEILMVAGAGHYPHVERPDVVAPRVLTFLDDLAT